MQVGACTTRSQVGRGNHYSLTAQFFLNTQSKLQKAFIFVIVTKACLWCCSHGFTFTSNSEQKEQTNKEKYVFYCSVSQIYINPEKTRKKHQNDVFGRT